MLCPETYPTILGHEPIAASSIADTSDAICLKNAKGVLITVVHATNSNVDLVLTVHEGDTAAVAAAGTYALAKKFPIWVTANCTTTDVPERQTDAITYTIDADVLTGTSIVQFYIDADKLTDGRDWVALGTSGGGTGLACVLYQLDGVRYQQSAPDTAIA